jgi:putative aldouronate transport system permease protein
MSTFEQADVDAAVTRDGEDRLVGKPTGKRPVWMEKPHPVAQVVKFVFLGLAILLVIIPFWSVVATSLADQKTINDSGGGMVMWPKGVTFEAYVAILTGGVVTQALVISIGITVVGTLLSLAATAGLAYWLARRGSLGSKPVLMLVLGAVLFAPGLIPTYLVVKEFRLLDSWASLILPVLVNAFNVIVMRAFFQELPEELFESAEIDGASSATILFRIVLPLSKAVMAVIGLFYAVAYWNAFFNALLYINTPGKWPMALVLRTYVVNQTAIGGDQVAAGGEALPPQLSLQMAILVVAIVPILIVYPFLQKHFAKGVMIGAVKG